MKTKLISIVLLAALCLSFSACGEDNNDDPKDTGSAVITTGDDGTGTVAGTEGGADDPDDGTGTFPNLSAVADSVKQYYGETVTFVYKDDPYSDEVLMYKYGLYDEKYTAVVSNYVLSECDGMLADTFAIINFKSGTDKAVIEDAAETIKIEYVEALQNKLSAYDPDEYEAAGEYQMKVYDDAILLVISAANTDVILDAVGK